jgi:hypothetical protein
MSDIVADLRTYLLTQTPVTNEVGTRMYFDHLPQGCTLPALVLEQNDLQIIRHLTASTTLRRAQVNILVVSESHTSARAAQAAIQDVVEFDNGTWGSTNVRRSYVDDEYDGNYSPGDASEDFTRVAYTTATVWFVDA